MRLPVNQLVPLAALTLLLGCGSGDRPQAEPVPATNGPASDYPMVIGAPFVVDGVTYTPSDTMNYDTVGYAAMGETGDESISAAHRTLPVPSYVEVTSLDSGKTILVRVERRGPMTGDRLIELSPGATAQLGLLGKDRPPVRVRRVNPPEPERAMLRSRQRAPDRMDTPKSLVAVLMRKLDPKAVVPALPDTPLAAGPVPKPSPAPSAAQAVVPRIKPLPRTRPVPATAPTPQPVSAATPARTSPQGRFAVQAGAFSSRDRANVVAAKIGGHVSPHGNLWIVHSGPFATRAAADAALAKAKSAGYSDARIQRAAD